MQLGLRVTLVVKVSQKNTAPTISWLQRKFKNKWNNRFNEINHNDNFSILKIAKTTAKGLFPKNTAE